MTQFEVFNPRAVNGVRLLVYRTVWAGFASPSFPASPAQRRRVAKCPRWRRLFGVWEQRSRRMNGFGGFLFGVRNLLPISTCGINGITVSK
jgi:hypothetical protein